MNYQPIPENAIVTLVGGPMDGREVFIQDPTAREINIAYRDLDTPTQPLPHSDAVYHRRPIHSGVYQIQNLIRNGVEHWVAGFDGMILSEIIDRYEAML